MSLLVIGAQDSHAEVADSSPANLFNFYFKSFWPELIDL